MLIEIKVPQLSESVAEATLVRWNRHVGEAVARDENLIDIETDKVVMELPAPAAGVLAEVLRGNGDTVVAGEVIARIDTTAAAAAAPPPAVEPAAASLAGPAARKRMAEQGLAAADVKGSGPGGRVTKADLPAGATPLAEPPVVAAEAIAGGRTEQRVPMSRLRARIAERLVQSKNENAILTTFNEVNMAAVIELRKKYAEKFEKEHGVKLGFMSFFVRAVTHALKRFPVLNASVDGSDIVYHGYFDIGIAVGSPRGLVVPIIRDAARMSLAQVENKIAEFGQKAKDGKLSLEDLTGGTFSISNGGIFGSMLSTPIINPPQSAILGIHATKDRPVAENGQVVIRPMNYLALSYDHRIIDGREAVLGLVAIKEALEDPARLLLDL